MSTSHHAHPTPTARLLRWMRNDRNDMLLVLLYAVASSIVGLCVPITVQAIVNTVAFGTLLQPLVVLALLVFAALLASAIFRALQVQVVETIQERVLGRTALELTRSLPRVDPSVHEEAHGPELVNRFFDVVTIQKAGATLLVDGSALALQTIVGMVLLAFYHPYLLAFDGLLLLAMAFVFFALGRGAERTAIEESKAKYRVAAWLQELLRHRYLFKDPAAEELARERTYALTEAYLSTRRDHFRVLFRQVIGAFGLQVLFSSLLIAIGGYLVLQKQLTLGQLIAAELIVSSVLAGFSKVGKQLESLYDMLAGLDKVGHLTDLPEEPSGRGRFPRQELGPVTAALRDVTVMDEGRVLLEGASLEVERGERVALVGGTGAGKSSLMGLLYGAGRPARGVVEVDGETVHTLTTAALRSRVRIASGDELFEGTVLENVFAGRKHLSVEDARRALETVQLWGEIKAWPDGVDTAVRPRGHNLSSGQVQKIVLARAIVDEPCLLLIDHALDDLDPEGRAEVARALLSPDRPWTAIVATNQESVARSCTRTIAVDGTGLRELPRPGGPS